MAQTKRTAASHGGVGSRLDPKLSEEAGDPAEAGHAEGEEGPDDEEDEEDEEDGDEEGDVEEDEDSAEGEEGEEGEGEELDAEDVLFALCYEAHQKGKKFRVTFDSLEETLAAAGMEEIWERARAAAEDSDGSEGES